MSDNVATCDADSAVLEARHHSPVRLLIASPTFFPTYGGAQLRFKRYLPGLTRHGMDISVFTGTPTRKDSTPAADLKRWKNHSWGSLLPETAVEGVPVQRVCLPTYKGLVRSSLYYKALLDYCQDADNRPQVIQFISDMKPRALPWIHRLRALGIRLVFAVTIAPEKNLFTGNPGRQRVNRLLYNTFDQIIVATSFIKNELRQAGITVPIEVIPNGVNTHRFGPATPGGSADDIRQQLGIPKNSAIVLAVGRVSERKGSHLILEAWRKIEKNGSAPHLIFAGPFESQGKNHRFRQKILDAKARLKHPERVHLAGFQKDIRQYYGVADLLVLASAREGMPNCVLEGMASKTAVLLTDYRGFSEDLGVTGTHFMMTQRQSPDIAQGIIGLLNDPQNRDRIAAEGYQRVISQMNMDVTMARYTAAYRNLGETAAPDPLFLPLSAWLNHAANARQKLSSLITRFGA